MTTLTMWTVYDHPKDYPDHFIARRFEIGADVGIRHTTEAIIGTDIEAIRDEMQRRGLVKLMRNEEDDPVIMETWL